MDILKKIADLGLSVKISRGTNCKIFATLSPLFRYDVIDHDVIFLGDSVEQILIKILDYVTFVEI